ncbi:DUF2268 domain-containing putative Zn-dependent protease [Tissierella sp. MB52-C2]|uniref:DUF2268 domain-containing protein n=1 Tax=Tissierella sp. MB52-C2 TaxID=3070999 RepID=UPI00280A5600|nr:DUF2268 domain-containing putative Zn-dependent protease [Tissierella sp. MB52-C2]WMM24461.1 DUF2268 domain-containing putative Zn-dependent protease [Tissierella sp. MB52-C2]
MNKKSIIVLLLLIIVIFTTIGCEKETSKVETESKFNIIFPEEELREYIRKAKENEEEIDELYKEIVYEPIRSELTKDTEYPDYEFPNIQYTIKNLDKLEKSLEIFCIEKDIICFAENVLWQCDSFLSREDATVYIMPLDPDNVHFSMGGVTGVTSLDGKILVCINPMIDDWEELFPYALAHEYHHSVLMKDKSYEGVWNISMLENLLLEGRADSFADIVYPDVERTLSPLSIIREKEMWDKIKENFDSMDYGYQREIMFGGIKGIPRNCGYTIGYNIMQAFIKNNPDVSVEEWTNMDAKEILEKSGYEESLEKRLEDYNN